MLQLRRASKNDLEFLIKLDLEEEGYTPSVDDTPVDVEEYCARISGYVHDADKGAWVFEDTEDHEQVGGILCRFRNLKTEPESANNWTFFESLRQFLPDSGRFCEVFNLWVAPDFRRQGLATRLKRQLEIESHRRDIEMIYTHTERTNPHVIELNLMLGYREIRRGLIWDEIERVSLTKDLI